MTQEEYLAKYKRCETCRWTDGMIYCSLPPMVKCVGDKKFHFKNHSCEDWLMLDPEPYIQGSGVMPPKAGEQE